MSTTVRGRGGARPGDRPAPRRRPRRSRPEDARERRPAGRMRPSARIRRRRRVFWLVVLAVLLTGTLGYLLYFSPVLGVRAVRVEGLRTVSQRDVVAAARVPIGDPLLRVNTGAIAGRVAALPKVAAVDVSRSWPSTVVVTVTERSPVAVLRAPDGIKLVDATGYAYDTVAVAPTAVPEIVVASAQPGDPATSAALHVLLGLPGPLHAEVLTVTARSPNDVRVVISAGREIDFGDDQQLPRKVAVAQALLTRPGKVFDVASPDAPTIS